MGNEQQRRVYEEFKKRGFGPDVTAMRKAGFGGSLGDEYQRGVAGVPPLSAPDSVARGAWKAGKEYRNQ